MKLSRRIGIYIPPGGFIGSASQTQANQLIQRGMPGAPGRARKRRKSATASSRRRTRAAAPRKRRAGRKMRLVKGSAAAKRYMAKIRRMRKR